MGRGPWPQTTGAIFSKPFVAFVRETGLDWPMLGS